MIPVRTYLLPVAFAMLLAPALPAWAIAPVSGERFQAEVIAYQQADTRGKREFLETLLARSDAAASVIFKGAKLHQVRQRNAAILERAAEGRELTSAGLVALLGEVDDQEHAAIAKLRRDFAFSTAQAFHDNRAEFDKWHDAWERIEKRYNQDGRPQAWQPRMIDWLALATARQAQSNIAKRHPKLATKAPPRTAPRGPAPNIRSDELEARIAGYNFAVSRLFSELHAQKQWTIDELGGAAGELASLVTTRHDLTLYWRLLPEEQQARLTPLRTLDDLIPLLARRTADRRRALENEAADSPRAAWELRRLDEVSRRLATLASPRG